MIASIDPLAWFSRLTSFEDDLAGCLADCVSETLPFDPRSFFALDRVSETLPFDPRSFFALAPHQPFCSPCGCVPLIHSFPADAEVHALCQSASADVVDSMFVEDSEMPVLWCVRYHVDSVVDFGPDADSDFDHIRYVTCQISCHVQLDFSAHADH